MSLVGCALLPHPPIMVPEVGRGELSKIGRTVEAAKQAADFLLSNKPDTIVIISPHAPFFAEFVGVNVMTHLQGNLAAFGAPEVALSFEPDESLVADVLQQAAKHGVDLRRLTEDFARKYRFSLQLDHGALVPLYYLNKAGFCDRVVHLSIGMLSYEEMFAFGKAVRVVAEEADKKVAVIASGDLSHRLVRGAPAGYDPAGVLFDKEVVDSLRVLDAKKMFGLDSQLVDRAGECGLRPIFFLLGVLDGHKAASSILSYEGPFGVGYAVATFQTLGL